MSLELVRPRPFSRDEALTELAKFIGDELIEADYAKRVTASFNARPGVIYPPDADAALPHVTACEIAYVIAEAQGLTVPNSWGRKKYYRNVLAALRGEAIEQ